MTKSLVLDDTDAAAPGTFYKRRQQGWKSLSTVSRYAIVLAALAVLVVILQFVLHAVRSDPRNAAAIAQRELALNTIEPGERIALSLPVSRRTAIDYFRVTHGLLVLTDRRLIFLGLRPRDLLAPPDIPPTFDERVFPVDTLVSVAGGRAMLGLSRGVVVRTPDGSVRLAYPSTSRPAADKLVTMFKQRDAELHARGVRQRKLTEQAQKESEAARARLKQPRHYTVRRGDALGAIATRWNVTPAIMRAWNKKPNDNIRVGEVLMVWPGDAPP
jgi:LysM repeat protein